MNPGSRLPATAVGSVLAHFTRASAGATALDNLISILAEGRIRAGTRMIPGRQPVVCLFDSTLEELARILTRSARRRYQPFGVAMDRRHAFALGARPVIYLPWGEARELLPADQLWRVVRLELAGARSVDWSFEREWRMAGDLRFAAGDAIALVESWQDVDSIYQHFEGHPPCAGVLPLNTGLAVDS